MQLTSDAKALPRRCAAPRNGSVRRAQQLLHELQAHQVELQAQNEELRRTQAALAESGARYADLYELAPVGYLTLCGGATIVAINAAGAALLGEDRGAVLHLPFDRFVAACDGERWQRFVRSVLRRPDRQTCELALQRGDGRPVYVRLDGIRPDLEPGVLRVVLTDVTERKAAEKEIKYLTCYDPLTHLPNRRLLLERLHHALARCARRQRQGALLFVDLDNFKNLNDTLGHDKGDLLLQQAAQRLAACVGDGDTVARPGGDEFIVMLEDLGQDVREGALRVETLGARIQDALGRTYGLGGYEFHCTPSIGVALFGARQETVDDVMRQAELALYPAKGAGRNAVRFFDQEMQAAVSAQVARENDLRHAIGGPQFVLHYQAQVDAGGRCRGVEALLRWEHPQGGMVSPAEFIPLAEASGLILPLGRWVLEAACRQLAVWATRPGMAHLAVAVNISPLQFRHADFVEHVVKTLRDTGANPQRLKLEMTESLLVSNVEDTIDKMNVLKKMGVGFSLDDFGTGYSSLSYLSRLPLDQLKIDRSFVKNIESNDNDAVICAATISLAHSLKLKVVAEGVETNAQRYFLNTVHHCDLLQGYLFSRPLPPAEFEAFLWRN